MSLDRSGKWNPGGGNYIEVVPAAGVASYLRPSSSSTPVITLREGFAWTRIYCTQGTLQYREVYKDDDQGDLHELDIKGFSPDDSPAKSLSIQNLKQYKRVLVRFRDNARLTRLAGTPIESLLFTYELGTDAEVGGSRGYNLSFSGPLTEPAAYAQ
ncbi:hypothetical protein [Tellurirhabdus bombi]|uniref:hypothetical protein n=1 Tax=Tellurirhabdus bombi TaxID=2907205 RepID=UPI001F3C9291|nr:hypothetical protein [Tellurirhabdus bombi]